MGKVDTFDTRDAQFEVRIFGRLSASLVEELTSAEITLATTGFTVAASDEAALHGLLRRIEALGLEIESITRLSDPRPGRPTP